MAEQYGRPDGRNRFQIRSAALGTLPAAWLDEEFNKVYSSLNSITVQAVANVSEWTVVTDTFSYLSPNSFIVPANYTAIFEELRAVKITDNTGNSFYSHVQSSIYNAGTGTTITLIDSVVPETIEEVSVGLISSQSASLPSTHTSEINTSSAYTPNAEDSVLLVNDSNGTTVVWDDEQKTDTIAGEGSSCLQIILPQPSTLKNKMLYIKKIGGNNKIVIASTFTHSTEYIDTKYVHHNTYSFQILPQGIAKNRIELKGIGDFAILVSDGVSWFEITPRSTEKVEGLVRLATEEEITLTQEQKDKGEELSKELAVSPYNLDKIYTRSNAANTKSASNFIYEQPQTTYLSDGVIYIQKGLSLSIPTGRDDKGVITTKSFELKYNLTFAPVEVTDKVKLIFIGTDNTIQPILSDNYYVGYDKPKVTGTQTGDVVLWFDFSSNLIKKSTDNGTNWTTFDGAGPICEFYGNGATITNILPYYSVGFLTRDYLGKIYRHSLKQQELDWSSMISYTRDTEVPSSGIVFAGVGQADAEHFVYITPKNGSRITVDCGYSNDGPMYVFFMLNKGDKFSWNTRTSVGTFVPFKGYTGS